MAIPTYSEIKALSFGYLSGADLLKFCPSQILIKQYQTDTDFISDCVDMAYSEIISNLINRYDIKAELALTTGRNLMVVKLTAICAVKNLTGEMSGIPENMIKNFEWLNDTLLAIRNGQMSLTSLKTSISTSFSEAEIVQNNFETLG